MSDSPDVLYISPKDPWLPATGGQTAFAKQMLHVYRGRLAVVSSTTDSTVPLGKWIQRDYCGEPVWYFSIGNIESKSKGRLPFLPRRIKGRLAFKKYFKKILEIGLKDLFLDSPELLDIIGRVEWNSICYRFAGLNNPYTNSRYKILRPFGEFLFKRNLKSIAAFKTKVLIAAADEDTITSFRKKYSGLLSDSPIHSFPTRFNPDLFHPLDPACLRTELKIENRYPRLVSVGRYCWIKGWDLALEAVKILKEKYPSILITFVGDGEDRQKIIETARRFGLDDNICLTGFVDAPKVCEYVNASDLCLVASYREGWSVAMTELLGCGKCIVSTNVSGASSMIKDGESGFVVANRDPVDYASAIDGALSLQLERNKTSLGFAEKYSSANLERDLSRYWAPISKKNI